VNAPFMETVPSIQSMVHLVGIRGTNIIAFKKTD
jgi:hypothetical protein